MPSCRALQALRPAAEFRIVPEGGHFFPISNAARVMDWLRPFFQIEAESPPRAAPSNPNPPAPAVASAAAEVPPIGFKSRVLANGMKVFYSADRTTPNVTVQVWYGVGAKDDPAGRSGFAHLFEHLMFKATRDLPAESFDRMTDDVGAMDLPDGLDLVLTVQNYHDLHLKPFAADTATKVNAEIFKSLKP
eukprot:gene13361-17745_t